MKGITQLLRDLKEPFIVTDMERSDIHKLAKRVGVAVRVEKIESGFRVSPAIPKGTPLTKIFPKGIHATGSGRILTEVDKDFDFGA